MKVAGQVQLSLVHPRHGWIPLTQFKSNLVLFDWGSIAANLFSKAVPDYRIGGMFIEFENVASPGDPVVEPTFDRDDGLEYYNGLISTPDRDYLRVPLISSMTDNSNSANFPADNRVTYHSQSIGAVGVHGTTFSDLVNSKIFGAGLVGFKNNGDSSQDIVMSRFYFDVSEQQVKLPTSQVGITWVITFN